MKKIFVLLLLVTSSLVSLAETVEEGIALHPNANFYYCKEKIYGEDVIPPMSPIERIAWDKFDVYIKFYNQDDEIKTRLNGSIKEYGDWRIFPMVIGEFRLNIEDEKLKYYGASGKLLEIFDLDINKSADALMLKE